MRTAAAIATPPPAALRSRSRGKMVLSWQRRSSAGMVFDADAKREMPAMYSAAESGPPTPASRRCERRRARASTSSSSSSCRARQHCSQ
eukprot:6912380-Prymnesium_polylepis.1